RYCKPVYTCDMALTQSERGERHRQRLAEIKLATGCVDCGYRVHAVALHFDHRPGTVKLFGIGNGANRVWSTVLAEIAKCDVVCANCHADRTGALGRWLLYTVTDPDPPRNNRNRIRSYPCSHHR